MPGKKGSSNAKSEGKSVSPATRQGSRNRRALPTTLSRDVTPARQLSDSPRDTPERKRTPSSLVQEKTLTPVEQAGVTWLQETLEGYGLRDIHVHPGPVKWQVRAEGGKLGDIENRAVMDRDVAVLQRMLRLPVVVRVEMVRPSIEEFENLEDLHAARKALYDELFEAGRLSAKYLTDLCQDLRWEYYGRKNGHSEDKTALATWAYQRIAAFEDERMQKKKIGLTGAVRSVLGQQVMTSFAKWRKSNYSEQLAVFTSNTILLRYDSWRLERTTAPVRWVVHFAVSSQRVPSKKKDGEKPQALWHSVVISTNKNPSVHATLRKLVSGEIKPCDAKLMWEKGNRCWVFKLVGMRERPPARTGSNVMAIRRGLETPMFRLLANGRTFPVKGQSYLEQKRRLAARKSKMQGAEWERGGGNRSHGRKKRKEVRRHLSEREANVTKSFVRQVWGETIKLAKRHGVGVIVMEDFGTPVERSFLETLPDELAWMMKRFPWGDFKAWGQWVCKRVGIRFIEVSAAGRSHICPVCRDETPHNYVPAVQQLHCQGCGAKMPAVFAEGWNMLIRSGELDDDSSLRSMQRGWQKQIESLNRKRKGQDELDVEEADAPSEPSGLQEAV